MFRKKIVNIVRDFKRSAANKDIDYRTRLRWGNDTLAKIEGFLDLRIITFNEYKLLSRYLYNLIDNM